MKRDVARPLRATRRTWRSGGTQNLVPYECVYFRPTPLADRAKGGSADGGDSCDGDQTPLVYSSSSLLLGGLIDRRDT
jgi:hypothetical protein